jgi:sensor histidine kinase YesM
MTGSLKKSLLWLVIILFIFGFFRWLFGMAIPKAAFGFSAGITVILVTGLFSGRFSAKAWLISKKQAFNKVIASLIGGALICLTLIGFFISRMIKHTEFNFFFFTIVCLFLLSAIAAALITLIRIRVKSNMQVAQAALTHSKTELQLLQSQLSPHFLFNTLNNIYGLSISDHTRVPALLLKLSELLRYTVYEAKEVYVPLQDEIHYLENYIEFEKIRLGTRLSLSSSLQQVVDSSVTIDPMLLVVFVENAFKHSKNIAQKNIFIEIKLELLNNKVHFNITNSYHPGSSDINNNKNHSGFGLESVRKRLNLLYNKKHELEIITTINSFTVNLVLETDEHKMYHSR